jgi:hypothetical protein
MKRPGNVVASALAAAWVGGQAVPAAAQGAAELRNPNVTIDYYEPRSPALVPLYQRVQDRRVLERLGEFLAPVQWPKRLRVMMKQCPPSNGLQPEVHYSTIEYSLTICYQWLGTLRALRPPPAIATRQEAVVGGLIGMVLRSSALAMFDMLNVPLLGAADDAADQMSTFVALKFGDDAARVIVKGSYLVWREYDLRIIDSLERYGFYRQYDFASPSSLPRQRMYNVLCIAHGGAPRAFKDFVDRGDLPANRADHCEEEYRQVEFAFQKAIAPRIDAGAMSRVRAMNWLDAEDLK